MAEILLTPELLMTQSAEMQSLQTEYEALFAQVNNALNGMNDSWSANIASNFVGKIALAQKSFSSIVNMMQNGSAAAKMGALTFADGVGMGDILDGILDKSDSKLSEWIQQVQIGGPGMRDAFNKLLKNKGIDGQSAISIMEKIEAGDYTEALKIYDGVSQKISSELRDALPLGDGLADSLFGDAMEEAMNNTLYHIPRDAGKAFSLMLSDNATPSEAAELYGQVLWHWGGSPAEGFLNVMKDKAFEIYPEAEEYWKSTGANTDSGVSVFSHAVGETISSVSKDDSWKETYSIYDNGVAEGFVGAVKDIGSFGVDKANELINNIGLHSIFR